MDRQRPSTCERATILVEGASHSARLAGSTLAHQFSIVGIRLAGPSRRRQLMEDKRDPDMDNDEIGNSNEEDVVDSADDEFEDADEEDDDETDEPDTNLES
jgi:hypothetical protein